MIDHLNGKRTSTLFVEKEPGLTPKQLAEEIKTQFKANRALWPSSSRGDRRPAPQREEITRIYDKPD
jgi:hypothetical protein